MFEVLMTSLTNWNATKNERQKLQHGYLALAVVVILIAGIISLFNASLGHNVVKVALVALAAFIANAFAWNLMQSSLLAKLTTKPKRR